MSWWAGEVKSMSLTGEYVYLLLKPLDMKFFLVHLDWRVGDKVVRRSIVGLGGWRLGWGWRVGRQKARMHKVDLYFRATEKNPRRSLAETSLRSVHLPLCSNWHAHTAQNQGKSNDV